MNESKTVVNRMEQFIKYAIIILVAGLMVLLFFLVQDYRALRRKQVINTRELWFAAVLKNHGYLGASNVTLIAPWMTFDYVNRLFDIPSGYLKATLTITDAHYPKLSISSYARTDHVTSAALVLEVENALRTYFAGLSAGTASSTNVH